MTLTSLSAQYRAALAMLAAMIQENRVYTEAFGFPSGKTCPHCNREVFASAETLEQVATVQGAKLGHDYCVEIARLNTELANGPKLTLVQLPNPKAEGDGDPANPDQPPTPAPAPAPAPIPEPQPDEPPKEDTSACA
jgi:hypothetical protein